MTNLQSAVPARWKREPLLLALPVVVGVVVGLGVGAGLLWPSWQRLQLAQQELEQLEEQRQRLPLLRAQLLKLTDQGRQAEQRRSQILGLIAGSGQISTFMAQLSEEAQRSGVQLDSYEPITAAAPPVESKTTPSKRSSSNDKVPAPPADPLLAPGLQKTSLLLTARGSGPQLLAFLRGLERLSLLVVQSDLSLSHEVAGDAKPAQVNTTNLRLNLSLYSKDTSSRDNRPSDSP